MDCAIIAPNWQIWHNLHMSKVAGIGKAYREKLSLVLRRHPRVITPKEVSNVLNVSAQEAGRLLSRWYKHGWISRVKRGVYVPLSVTSTSNDAVIEEPFLIADSLYGPGYIGGFSAVKYWDFSEQIIEATTYYTLKKIKNRNPLIGGAKFNLKTISEYKVFGLKPIWFGGQKVKVSDPTKTIIDLFDDPKIVGGIRIILDVFREYFESEHYDFDKLVEYGLKMKNATIFKRLGFILEINFEIEKEKLISLKELISSSYSELDPTLECNAYLNEWKLKVSNSWLKEYDRKR